GVTVSCMEERSGAVVEVVTQRVFLEGANDSSPPSIDLFAGNAFSVDVGLATSQGARRVSVPGSHSCRRPRLGREVCHWSSQTEPAASHLGRAHSRIIFRSSLARVP